MLLECTYVLKSAISQSEYMYIALHAVERGVRGGGGGVTDIFRKTECWYGTRCHSKYQTIFDDD